MFRIPTFRLTSLVIPLAITLRLASESTATVSYVLIAGYALLGREHAIRALFFSWLFTMLSPGIAPEMQSGGFGRYLVILAAAMSVMLRSGFLSKRASITRFTAVTLTFGLLIIAHSLVVSPFPDVSLLKAISWTVVTITLVSAWHGMDNVKKQNQEREIFGLLILLLVVSAPLAVNSLGYLRNGIGFQGILNHPQAFGPTIALLGAWAASKAFTQARPMWSHLLLLVGCVVAIVLSGARTAGVALILGFLLSIIATPMLKGGTIHSAIPGLRSRRTYLIMLVSGIFLASTFSFFSPIVDRYLIKRESNTESSIIGAYQHSRGGLVEDMWANIQRDPIKGIGFGIASNPHLMDVKRDPILGLPTSAAIEKGVLPIAILEEVGVFGFLAFVIWVFFLLKTGAKGGIGPIAVGSTALFLNMGESTLFSPGGLGLLVILLVTWVYASGTSPTRTQQPE